MMPIQSVKNLYPGINAHLMSLLQNEPGEWESYHFQHVTYIRDSIEPELPSYYIAQSERSLQIRGGDDEGRPGRIIPDVTIVQTRRPVERFGTVNALSTIPTATLPLGETIALTEEDFFQAVMIYDMRGGGRKGTPVTRIELLSPSNKPPNSDYHQYLEKRDVTLRSGLRLVEIDYLHQTRSPIALLPNYPKREKNAYPYTILVSDPRPILDEGQMAIYGFSVGDPFPIVDIPLADKDVLAFDFGVVYNRTYEARRFHAQFVDYEQLPDQFDTYSPTDQERIKHLMQSFKDSQAQP